MFNPFDADDWNSVLGELGRGFTSFGNLVADGSISLVGTIGNGVIGVFNDAAGGIAYALDATKTTANDIGSWTEGAAGSVADFSVDAYSKAKQGIEYAWAQLNLLGTANLPDLGPPNPEARAAMKYLLGGSEAAVAGWESNARSLGYTMAFNVGCSVQFIESATVFSGIYLDRGGNWGYFRGTETTGPALLRPSANASFEMWMVFGDRDRCSGSCRKVELDIELPFAMGLKAAFKGGVLLSTGFAFLGFHIEVSGGLGSLSLVNGGSLSPSISAPDGSEIAGALAEKAGGFDAAVRALNIPSAEPKMIASAALATVPFVRVPNSEVMIQIKGSRKVYDVAYAAADTRSVVNQTTLSGYDNQKFVFTDNGDGSYRISPTLTNVSNAAFDITGASSANGAQLIQYPFQGQNNQRFQIMSADNGWYYLLNKNSGKVLSLANGSLADRTTIVQRTWDHGQDQMVRFISSSDFPTMNRSYLLTNVALNQQLGSTQFAPQLSTSFGSAQAWKIEGATDYSGSQCLRSSLDRYLGSNNSSPLLDVSQTSGWHLVPTGDGVFSIDRNGQSLIATNEGLAMSCQQYNVPGQNTSYDWTATGRSWALPQPGRGMVSFVADCAVDDVYVFITSEASNNGNGYEIIIGGWDNTRSAIRRGRGGTEVAFANVGLTNRNGENPLWVSIDSVTGRVEVGRGLPGQDVFMSYKDPNFIATASLVTFTSNINPIQYTQVTTLPIPANSAVAIPPRYGAFDFSASGKIWTLPEAGRGTVMFTATDCDVYVGISTQNTAGGQLYQIIIGGWDNTKSVIRRGIGGTELASAATGIKAPGKSNPMWISIDSTTGWIKVGRGLPGQDVFLSYQDASFISAARYVMFSAWGAPIDYSQVSTLALNATPVKPSLGFGLWRLSEVSNVPASNGAYDASRPRWRLDKGRGVFSFTIDNNDAYIKLSPSAGSSNASYEIILGGWDNTKSVIRRNGAEIAWAPARLLNPGGRNAFWISIDDRTGMIQIGRNAPGQEVILFAIDSTLRNAPAVNERYVNLSAWGLPIFYSNIVAAPLTSNVSPAIPNGPDVDHYAWGANLPVAGSTHWVNGCGVRYAVAFEFDNGNELRGPWWSIGGTSDSNGYYKPTAPTSYGLPLLTNVAVDASRKAVARRIYRQFLVDSSETLIARIPNNVDTTYRDSNP